MSFDARSRERLEALGRSLPQKLAAPASPPTAVQPAAEVRVPAQARHRLETEQNPDQLFHALIEASPDGSVPPHLLERLRSLEQPRPAPGSGLEGRSAASTTASVAAGGAVQAPGGAAAGRPSLPRRSVPQRPNAPSRRAVGPERELYAAFDDLLHLEHDDGPDPLPAPRLPANDLLLPKPTLRGGRPGS